MAKGDKFFISGVGNGGEGNKFVGDRTKGLSRRRLASGQKQLSSPSKAREQFQWKRIGEHKQERGGEGEM
jgi:hypothetical protein